MKSVIVYSYIRMSTKAQSLDGKDSFRRQSQLASDFCKEKGYTLDKSLDLHDIGRSGFKGDNIHRGRLGVFLKMVEDGKIPKGSILAIESFDRLSRQAISKTLSVMLDIVNAGVEIVTLNDGRRWNTETIDNVGDLMFSIIIMSRANEESVQKGKRIKAAWVGKRKAMSEGKQVRYRLPFWLQHQEGKTTVVAEKAEVVRRIFKLATTGNGLNTIVNRLNGDKVPTLGRNAKNGWAVSSVNWILKNETVIGTNCIVEPHIPKFYPSVVSESDFYKAQTLMAQRNKFTGNRSKARENVFSGLLFCKACGAKIHTHNRSKKTPIIFVCSNGKKNRCECKWSGIQQGFFEQVFFDEFFDEGVLAAVFQNDSTKDNTADKISIIQGKLNQNRKGIEKLTDLILANDSPEALVKRLKEMEAENIKLEAQITNLKGQQVVNNREEDRKLINELIDHPEKLDEPAYVLKLREFFRNSKLKVIVDLKERKYSPMWLSSYEDPTDETGQVWHLDAYKKRYSITDDWNDVPTVWATVE